MGQVVIFDQSLLHKANIAETTKYTMRTDILVKDTSSRTKSRNNWD
jgi:hypothetical protein